jgi:hypothetical protein
MGNQLYEFGGTADVLIKCKTERTIDGITYQAGEPYTMLKDVTIQLDYEQTSHSANAKTPIMDTRDGRPYQLIIGGVPLNRKITNLILSKDQDLYTYTKKEIITCWEEGVLQLIEECKGNDEFYCYDSDFTRVSAEIKDDYTKLYGNFVKDQQYLVFYTATGVGNGYKFEIPHYAYFSIEIFAKGNTDKRTNNLYMAFDAASLVSVPEFNILSGGLLNTPLVFRLIYQYQKEPIVVFN